MTPKRHDRETGRAERQDRPLPGPVLDAPRYACQVSSGKEVHKTQDPPDIELREPARRHAADQESEAGNERETGEGRHAGQPSHSDRGEVRDPEHPAIVRPFPAFKRKIYGLLLAASLVSFSSHFLASQPTTGTDAKGRASESLLM